MDFLGICAVLILLPKTTATTFDTTFNNAVPKPKLWWAKELYPEFYSAGLMSTREIKYTAEAGFKSLISIIQVNDQQDLGDGEVIPTSAEERILVESLGLDYSLIVEGGGSFMNISAVKKIAREIKRMPRPIMIHCIVSYSATFLSLTGLAHLSANDSSFQPRVMKEDIARKAADVGLDFYNDGLFRLIAESVGETYVPDGTLKPAFDSAYLPYWHSQRLSDKVAVAGQLTKHHVKQLSEENKPVHVVNVRAETTSGLNIRAEVTLLNIKAYTGPDRQLPTNLRNNRIKADVANTYISDTSTVNYESSNPLEFGDSVGYNETLEKAAFSSHANITYTHAPLGRFNFEEFERVKVEKGLINILSDDRRVLIHADTKYHAAAVAVLLMAEKERETSSWALHRLEAAGVHADDGVRDVYKQALDSAATCSLSIALLVASLITVLTD